MEAASRPSRDPLPDLPLEDPADGATTAAARPAGPAAAPAAAAAEPDPAATQTLLKMEFIVGDGEVPMPMPAPPVVQAAPSDSQQLLEVDPDAPLSLEDTFEVDKMLSTPPVAAPAVAPAPTTPKPPEARKSALDQTETLTLLPDTGSATAEKAPAKAAPASSPSPASGKSAGSTPADAAAAVPTMVPLARRASLTAAAMKLAAASVAPAADPAPKPAQAATPAAAVPLKPRPVTPTAKPAAAAPVAAAPAAAPASTAPQAAPAATSPADAPSLASWANARAAAAASTKPATSKPAAPVSTRTGSSSTSRSAPSPAADRPRATAAAAAPVTAPAAPAAAAQTAAAGVPTRGMDRDFIARNQVVERYISGKLPIKAATDFERYCKEHPKLLDEMGLPERVNAGLRLLEASGKPEPWQEAAKPLWQQPAVVFGIAGFAAALAVALALVAMSNSNKTHKILELQRQVTDRTLDAATSTRIIRLLPSRTGASSSPAITIGGGEAQLVDFRIDESRSPYKDFRVTIDRVDQGRVMVIDNLTKDSNGHLRVAVNSSAFGPGNYQLTIEGLTMRLEPQPDSWVTIGIAQR